MSQGGADKLRNLRAAARPAQTRWPDKTSERDLAMDKADERSTGQIHPPRAPLLARATAVAGGQATYVVLNAPHRGLVDILRGRDRPIHDAMKTAPVVLALAVAANRTALLYRQFNQVRSPSTQATTNQRTRQRWLS